MAAGNMGKKSQSSSLTDHTSVSTRGSSAQDQEPNARTKADQPSALAARVRQDVFSGASFCSDNLPTTPVSQLAQSTEELLFARTPEFRRWRALQRLRS